MSRTPLGFGGAVGWVMSMNVRTAANLLALVGGVFLLAPTAAAADVTVGPAGAWPTLQAGVNHARPGDRILVAAGTYAENVNLSLMGSAVGSGPGDLVIEASSTPVLVSASSGSALYNSAPFPGDLTLRNLSFSATGVTPSDEMGILLVSVTGDVELTSCAFTSCTDAGLSARALVGDLSVAPFSASGGGNGIVLDDCSGSVDVTGGTAVGLAGDALRTSNGGTTHLVLVVDGVSVSGGTGNSDAFQVDAAGSSEVVARFQGCVATGLRDDAVDVDARGSSSVLVRVYDGRFTAFLDRADGIDLCAQDTASLRGDLRRNTVDGATGDGLVARAEDAASLVLAGLTNVVTASVDAGVLVDSDEGAASDAVLRVVMDSNQVRGAGTDGILLRTQGSTDWQATVTRNTLDGTNTDAAAPNGGSVHVAAAFPEATRLCLGLSANVVTTPTDAAYLLEQVVGNSFSLEGTQSTAALCVSTTNTGTPVTVVGDALITRVPIGSCSTPMTFCPPDTTVPCGEPISLPFEAIEPSGAALVCDVDVDGTLASSTPVPASGGGPTLAAVDFVSSYFSGASMVRLTATNSSARSDACSVLVTVDDPTPPSIQCPSEVRLECAASAGETVNFTVNAVDSCDPNPLVVCSPPSGSHFPFGTTTVTCTATDHAGNQASCSFPVILTFQPTSLTTSLGRTVLYPVTRGLVGVDYAATVDAPCVTFSSVEVLVYSDEANGVSPYSPDAVGTTPATLKLRAERAAPGDGRVYLVVLRTVEAGTGSTTVIVRTSVVPALMTVASISSANLQASTAASYVSMNGGAAPPGWFVLHSFSLP